jgi:hypothetical protein
MTTKAIKSKKIDIEVTIQDGGILEFEKTGIYPMYLLFYSKSLRRVWRFKQHGEEQNGVLKVNGKVTFNYFFDGFGCKMQSLQDGAITDEWEIELIKVEMRD